MKNNSLLIPPAKYDYLRNDDKSSRSPSLVLEDNEKLITTSIIIRDETNPVSAKYMHFPTIAQYKQHYHATSTLHNTHEVILHWQKQKPKFDIDGGTPAIHESIIEAIESAFGLSYGEEPNLVVIPSVNTDPNETKLSKHIIITNFAFANQLEAKNFTEKHIRYNLSSEESACLDNVNKSTQNFRLPLATNSRGRVLRPPPDILFDDLVVTNTANIPVLPLIADYTQKPITFTTDSPFGPSIDSVDPNIFRYQNTTNNLICYKRINPSFCDICQREHTSAGIYFAKFDNRITRHCYQSKKCIVYTTDANDIPHLHDPTQVKYADFYSVLTKYHNAVFPTYDHVNMLIDALKQTIFIKWSGSSSAVLVKLSDTEYELQKLCAFTAAMRTAIVTINNQKISLNTIIQNNMQKLSYRNFVFAPCRNVSHDLFNLFIGFAAKPIPNQELIQPILDHILNVWCSSNDKLYNYVLDWLASVLNGNKNGTAIVLYSEKQGAGKNIITDFIRDKIIGTAYSTETNDIEQLVSKFNNKFANKILTVVNEANNVEGDYHKTFDKLKDLITNSRITVERKGVDSIDMDDYNNYLVTTNNKSPIKISEHDRRYTLIKLNESKTGDREYFNNLHKYTTGEHSQAAASAFLHFLQNREITADIKKPIQTEWKEDLTKLHRYSDPIEEYIAQTTFTESKQYTDTIYDHFRVYCDGNGVKQVSKIALFKKLAMLKVCGETQREHKWIDGKTVSSQYVVIDDKYVNIFINNDEPIVNALDI